MICFPSGGVLTLHARHLYRLCDAYVDPMLCHQEETAEGMAFCSNFLQTYTPQQKSSSIAIQASGLAPVSMLAQMTSWGFGNSYARLSTMLRAILLLYSDVS